MNMRTDILEKREIILKWIADRESNSEIARRLKCKIDTLKSYYKRMNISYSGNQSMKGKRLTQKENQLLR